MLWIQMSDGSRIDELPLDQVRCKRNVEAELMVDGISLGQIYSWNQGAFYQLYKLYTNITREKLCWLLEHYEENNLLNVFRAMDHILDVCYVEGEDMNMVTSLEKQMKQLNQGCEVFVRRLTGINRQVGYVIYAKDANARLSAQEHRRTRGNKPGFKYWMNKPDKHLYF